MRGGPGSESDKAHEQLTNNADSNLAVGEQRLE